MSFDVSLLLLLGIPIASTVGRKHSLAANTHYCLPLLSYIRDYRSDTSSSSSLNDLLCVCLLDIAKSIRTEEEARPIYVSFLPVL